jgi:hypothetical protein
MTLHEELSQDMAAAIADHDQTFEWNGRAGIPCVRRDQPTAMELQDEGGFVEGVSYWLVVAKSEFSEGGIPEIGDLVNDDTHQIKRVNGHKDPAAVQLILSIGSIDE